MAKRISGITIEIGGDTSNLQRALRGVDTQLRKTQDQLKDVNNLLKLNPGNTVLLTQKQKALENAISLTKDRLEQLKEAQGGVAQGSAEWDAIQREIIDTQQKLNGLEKDYRSFGSVAKQQLQAVGSALQDAGGKVTDFGKKLAPVSGAAAAIGGSLLKIGYDAVTSADELNTLSKQTGISTDELQRMSYAADLVDVSVDDITGALRKLKSNIDPSNESLAALGVSAVDADGNLRDATDVFYDVLHALSEVGNETERDQLAMSLFGKGADSLAGIIDDGGAALQEYGQQAEELGLILDEDTLNALNETNDTIDQMKATISGTMAVIGSKVVPVLAPLLEKVADLIVQVSDKLSTLDEGTMKTILTVVGVVAALAPVITIGGQLISGLGTLISVIGTIVGVLGGPLTIAIGAVIAIGVLLWKNWDKVKQSAINLKNEAIKAWNGIKSAVSTVVDSVRGKVDSMKAKFDELKNKVTGVWETIKGILTGQISLPHIPLPHFSIQPPGWQISDLLQGALPSLGISWYKKAYDNPVMFTSPTVLATPGGYKGFGDGHGAEIVMGLDKLREIAGANQRSVVINVYPSAGMDEKALADKIQRVFVSNANQRRLLNA